MINISFHGSWGTQNCTGSQQYKSVLSISTLLLSLCSLISHISPSFSGILTLSVSPSLISPTIPVSHSHIISLPLWSLPPSLSHIVTLSLLPSLSDLSHHPSLMSHYLSFPPSLISPTIPLSHSHIISPSLSFLLSPTIPVSHSHILCPSPPFPFSLHSPPPFPPPYPPFSPAPCHWRRRSYASFTAHHVPPLW